MNENTISENENTAGQTKATGTREQRLRSNLIDVFAYSGIFIDIVRLRLYTPNEHKLKSENISQRLY